MTAPELPPEVLAFDAFLNEPPEYEDRRTVREYRHDAYRRWSKVLDSVRAALAARGPLTDKPAGFVKPDTDQQVFFYEQDFYVLSNFSAFRLEWAGIDFDTSEHAYHWMKFRKPVAGQAAIRDKVQLARSAHEAFKVAERHKADRMPEWDGIKVGIMRDILRAKADQHEYVRRKLLATGDRELVEDSWRDDYWGWGPNRDGQNMLGKLWMEIRAELRGITPKEA